MNQNQLKQIEKFTKKYYEGISEYHNWNHIMMVVRDAKLISNEFKGKVNLNCLISACYIHDIGRKIKDEGHPDTSMKLAIPFLKHLGINQIEIEIISDAVRNHDKDRILNAKTIEAKILFDADKLQILSVFGFLRVSYWLTAERHMGMNEVVEFLWKYITEVKDKYIQTKSGKRIVNSEVKKLEKVIKDFKSWQRA